MKKQFAVLMIILGLSLAYTASIPVAFAQQPETEVVLPDGDADVIEITDPGELLPPVPWGYDFNLYLANFWVYLATILAITQIFKKLLKWEDKKAFILSLVVGLLVTGAGYYFKLGALALAPWWGALSWFIAFALGSKFGYKFMYDIMVVLGLAPKKL